MKIGIFGGSFDPVHLEHILIVKNAVKELSLDKLFVVPCSIAPHKIGVETASKQDRLNMLKLAFSDEEKVEISTYELDNEGVSYTYSTVEHFKKQYVSDELYFIMGSDMLENFPTWKNPELIVKNANLLLVERKIFGKSNEELINKVKSLYNAKISVLNFYGENVSSTYLRTKVKLGLPLDGLASKEVENYIYEKGLYKGNELYSYVKSVLPEKRLNHVAGVVALSLIYAKKLKLDEKKVETASLLHDIAKYLNPQDFTEILPKNCPKEVAHQYIGEYIARTQLKVTDGEILNAIKYHTTGRPNMTTFEKVIYLADLLEPSRKFSGVQELRKAVDEDFEKGFRTCVFEITGFLINGGGDIFPLSIETDNYYRNN